MNSVGKQVVNQWICIAFICLLCFWVVLYYFVNKTEAFGINYISSVDITIDNIR